MRQIRAPHSRSASRYTRKHADAGTGDRYLPGQRLRKLALDAKKSYVARYGAPAIPAANPPWRARAAAVKVQSQNWRVTITPAAEEQEERGYQEAVKWYRSYLEAFPRIRKPRKTTSCWLSAV